MYEGIECTINNRTMNFKSDLEIGRIFYFKYVLLKTFKI